MSDTSRIESLETQVRTLKRMLFGVFGLVVVGGLLAATTLQTVPDVIRAKSFEVIDNKSNVVSRMFASKDGGVLAIFDQDKKICAGIYANGGQGATLDIHGEGGRLGTYLTASGLGIKDKKGGTIAAFLESNNSAVILIMDDKGEPVFKAPEKSSP